jgi:cell division protein FtsQ
VRANGRGRKDAPLKKNRIGAPAGKIRSIVLMLLAVITVAGTVYILSIVFKSAFVVHAIVFTGNTHLSDDELRSDSGLRGGENMMTLSCRRLAEKMVESRWIKSVSIRKEFPDKVIMRIKEAEPFALLDMKGRMFLVDDNGRMLEELGSGAVPFLPVITGDPFGEKEVFSEAIRLAKAIKETGLLAKKDHVEIIAHKPEELAANLDGILVKVGVGEYHEKLGRLMDLEEEIKRRHIPVDYIDLRFANRVVVKPVSEVIK